ncbi:MAG TPA: YtxH domain-containing protein [Polyangiaceae bacterium]|jgi:gas vesicle protein|nr:YtxH domain-containing protein [Polyangiaceae bacterium]
MRGISADDVLAALGLQRRQSIAGSILPIASGFAAGALAGAAVALLFAPKTGTEMRREITSRANDVTRRVSEAADGVMTDVRNALPIGEKVEEHAQPPRPSYMQQENGKSLEHGSMRMSPPPKTV